MVNVDGQTDGWTDGWIDGRTNKWTETCMPKSPMLKQVPQKHASREIQMSEFLILLQLNLLDLSYKNGACCNGYLDHTLSELSCDAELVQ